MAASGGMLGATGGILGFAGESDSEDELPSGWEERTTLDGRVYYANNLERATQWNHPRTGKKKRITGDFPPGWQRMIKDDKIVFVNESEGKETFTDPRLAFAVEDKSESKQPRQRFDASSSALHVLHGKDLSNRAVLVTGANAGLGFETARSLALHGAQLILVCRNVDKARRAADLILKEKATAKIEVVECDFASFRSIERAAKSLLASNWKLNILILNAAVFAVPFEKTEDGFEKTFQVNHLGQFYFVQLIEGMLVSQSSIRCRVVVVSSESHRFAGSLCPFGALNAATLTEEQLSPSTAANFWWMHAYNLSKLCNILFAFELNRRLYSKGVCVCAVHPGNMISTSLSRHSCALRALFALVRPFTKSLQQGCSTAVYCAVADELEDVGGLYFNNCWFCSCDPVAAEQQLQRKLWQLCDRMIQQCLDRRKGQTHQFLC